MTGLSNGPAPAPGPTVDGLRRTIAALKQTIDATHRQLEDGAAVELGGMEQQVAALCVQLTGLDRAEGEPLVDEMLELLDDFQALGGELGRRHDRLAAELQHLARHRKAMKAYSAGGRPPKRS